MPRIRKVVDLTQSGTTLTTMTRLLSHFVLVISVAATLSVSSTSFAQSAREVFEQGHELARVGRHAEALLHFERARGIEERPVIVFNIASTLAALGRSVEAVREFERFIEIARGDDYAQDREEAERLKAVLIGTITTVQLRVTPSSAVVEIDGSEVEGRGPTRTLRLDPGEHTITVRENGYITEVVDVENRREVTVVLSAEQSVLVVTAGSTNGAIYIDGVEAGRGEVRAEVTPGPHDIVVSLPDHDDFEQQVDVAPGAQVRVVASFNQTGGGSSSIARSPIFWTIVGVVVIGAAVGTAIAVTREKSIEQGTTGVTLHGLRF